MWNVYLYTYVVFIFVVYMYIYFHRKQQIYYIQQCYMFRSIKPSSGIIFPPIVFICSV